MLLRYYKIFKELNPKIRIGAIFTYAANASLDDGQTGMNQGFADSKVAADELQAIMDDYNAMFGTSFTTDNFSAYYDDVNERMKKRKKDMLPLDLLLVVGMFLTASMPRSSIRFMSTKIWNITGCYRAVQPHEPRAEREKAFRKNRMLPRP